MKVSRTVPGKYLSYCFLLLIATLSFEFTQRTVLPSAPHTAGVSPASLLSRMAVLSHTTVLSHAAVLFELYDRLQLGSLELSRDAFHQAVEGFLTLEAAGQLRNPDVLSIVDFSLPSSKKRLFIIDMREGRLLFNTLVAHGRNSGKLMATRFSNRFGSYMSSLGFYLTGQPFIGHNGYSLRLEGIEKGWNDHVLQRAIVMHPAPYVSEEHIRRWGFLGRSEGCPAIPENLHAAIIEEIKGGSCLFLYAPQERFTGRSDPFS
jgi:hypothetical protein